MLTSTRLKQCSFCKRKKTVSRFPRDAHNLHKRLSYCLSCQSKNLKYIAPSSRLRRLYGWGPKGPLQRPVLKLLKTKQAIRCDACGYTIYAGSFYATFRDEPDWKEHYPGCLVGYVSTLSGQQFRLLPR